MTTKTIPNMKSRMTDDLFTHAKYLTEAMRAQGLILHRDYRVSDLLSETLPADLAATIVIANALRAAYEAHRVLTSHHIAADSTNTVAAAAATDQASVNTLLNELKVDLNAHQALATAHDVGPLDGAVGAAPGAEATADATDLASSKALAQSLAILWNRHIQSGAPILALGPA